ncbi:3D domain-containing protein [Tepidibacillus fermentans]|uniref:3D (Asp-Asp-Asp) domain-containing protein n=1 Tax=Tepidibacillus fermentans TaxID=1281767 RepID=A0A4V2USX3_9BACI|nr:3D domain-containing protein [Tepidibacillus fermentans]TCS83131.1 3D (Asp-Asp-Asp) domain-containing protein [Tepidibacillus fermentans]
MSTKNKQPAKLSLLFLLVVISIQLMGFTMIPKQIENRNQNNHVNHDFMNEMFHFFLEDHQLPFLGKLLSKEQKEPIKAKSNETKSQPIFDLSKYEKVHVVATGYTAGKESTGKDKSHPQYGITYSGVRVIRGNYSTIAADLNVFPIGTVLYIPGYGYGVVADKGSAIKGNKLDLYFETIQDVYQEWGKREVDVYVIKKGDGTLTEEVMKEYNRAEPVDAIK